MTLLQFNPERHSLWQAAKSVLLIDPRIDIAIGTLSTEYGFLFDDDLPTEDFTDLVRADRDGSARVWSSWRQFAEDDIDYADEYETPAPSHEGPPYEIIYADPGWQFRNKKVGGSHKSGAVQQYRVCSQDELCSLPVSTLAANDSALFMWATVPMLPEAFEVMAAWGFRYKTCRFWDKERYGLGYWFRGQVEILMLGIRGKVKAFRSQERNIFREKSRGHSRKPESARNLIIEATRGILDGPRIELFSRDVDTGWDYWGDEVFSNVKLKESGEWLRK